MKNHKWWHSLIHVVESNQRYKSSSYDGKYVWCDLSIRELHCEKCNLSKVTIKDYETGVITKLDWAPYADNLKVIKDKKGTA